MKIGIVTFHRALNYGALLQAFALQYALTKLDAEPYLLDYRNPVIENLYSYPTFSERKTMKEKIKFLIQGKFEIERREKFEKYRKQFLNLSETIYTPDNIGLSSDKYDLFITGSDQVWNYDAHNFDANFFLKFVNQKSKKFSYAASFGVSSIPDTHKDVYFDLLNDFSMCSVREEQGIHILDGLGISQRRLDIDPTMLLTKEEWKTQFNIPQKSDEKYIFVYYFELTNTLRDYIENLSNETGYTVIYIGNPFKSPFKCKNKALKTADPIEFIYAISNAEYVVTNSFHGTALSIIFNKNFYVELLKKYAKVNSRIDNILKMFNLENHLICRTRSLEETDWSCVNKKMEELRSRSLEYLGGLIK